MLYIPTTDMEQRTPPSLCPFQPNTNTGRLYIFTM